MAGEDVKNWTPTKWLNESSKYFDLADGDRMIVYAFYCLARAVVGLIFLKHVDFLKYMERWE